MWISLDVQHEYWGSLAGKRGLSIPFYMVYASAMAKSNSEAAIMALGLISLFISFLVWHSSCQTLALTVHRLRDAGFHWALIFVAFIPFVGGIAHYGATSYAASRTNDKFNFLRKESTGTKKFQS